MEAPPRFELGRKAFAELCLTTWLCRHTHIVCRVSKDSTLRPFWVAPQVRRKFANSEFAEGWLRQPEHYDLPQFPFHMIAAFDAII